MSAVLVSAALDRLADGYVASSPWQSVEIAQNLIHGSVRCAGSNHGRDVEGRPLFALLCRKLLPPKVDEDVSIVSPGSRFNDDD